MHRRWHDNNVTWGGSDWFCRRQATGKLIRERKMICWRMIRSCKLDVCLSVHRCICVEKKNKLDATEWFIALIICSSCFGRFYAHHEELETMCYYRLWCAVPWLLVVGGQVQSSRLCVREEGCCTSCNTPLPGRIACCLPLTPDNQQASTPHHRR
jgi:hypothetical protein